jgi:hypothetical protein
VGLFGRGIRGGSGEAGRGWITCCEGVQKQLVIGVIFENGFAVIARRRQVLERPVYSILNGRAMNRETFLYKQGKDPTLEMPGILTGTSLTW